MVFKKYIPKKTRKRRLKRTRSKFKRNIKNVEHYMNNKPKYINIDDLIIKCNNILVKNEAQCNKFKKGIPKKFKGKPFNTENKCKQYNQCKKMFSNFMTGDEPRYNPKVWSDPIIEGTHNCYAYFLNDHIPKLKTKCKHICKSQNRCKQKLDACGDFKPQPGDYAANIGILDRPNRIYKCPDMVNKVIKDNTDPKTKKKFIFKSKFSQKCPPKYYKGALVIEPNRTYHFYRQDNNVRYSHKLGTLQIKNVDASGKPIYAPHLADRNYNKKKNNQLNYTRFCSYLCAPKNSYIKTNAI